MTIGNKARNEHTVEALPVGLLLLVEESVLVLGQHLLLTGHLGIPPLDGLCGVTVALQSSANGIDDTVNGTQALALPGLLGCREAPWGLPVEREKKTLALQGQSKYTIRAHTREDPRTGRWWA